MAIIVSGVRQSYGDLPAVRSVSLSVSDGELFALVGAPGAGKSTVVACAAGLVRPEAGTIEIDGRTVVAGNIPSPLVGSVLDHVTLDPHLPLRENIAPYAVIYNLPTTVWQARFTDLVARLDLTGVAKRRIGRLTASEQRRADFVRALIHEPRVLLLDEPTTGLDSHSTDLIWGIIKEQHSRGTTILFATSDITQAEQADTVAVLADGRVFASGSPQSLVEQYAPSLLTMRLTDPAACRAELQSYGLDVPEPDAEGTIVWALPDDTANDVIAVLGDKVEDSSRQPGTLADVCDAALAAPAEPDQPDQPDQSANQIFSGHTTPEGVMPQPTVIPTNEQTAAGYDVLPDEQAVPPEEALSGAAEPAAQPDDDATATGPDSDQEPVPATTELPTALADPGDQESPATTESSDQPADPSDPSDQDRLPAAEDTTDQDQATVGPDFLVPSGLPGNHNGPLNEYSEYEEAMPYNPDSPWENNWSRVSHFADTGRVRTRPEDIDLDEYPPADDSFATTVTDDVPATTTPVAENFNQTEYAAESGFTTLAAPAIEPEPADLDQTYLTAAEDEVPQDYTTYPADFTDYAAGDSSGYADADLAEAAGADADLAQYEGEDLAQYADEGSAQYAGEDLAQYTDENYAGEDLDDYGDEDLTDYEDEDQAGYTDEDYPADDDSTAYPADDVDTPETEPEAAPVANGSESDLTAVAAENLALTAADTTPAVPAGAKGVRGWFAKLLGRSTKQTSTDEDDEITTFIRSAAGHAGQADATGQSAPEPAEPAAYSPEMSGTGGIGAPIMPAWDEQEFAGQAEEPEPEPEEEDARPALRELAARMDQAAAINRPNHLLSDSELVDDASPDLEQPESTGTDWAHTPIKPLEIPSLEDLVASVFPASDWGPTSETTRNKNYQPGMFGPDQSGQPYAPATNQYGEPYYLDDQSAIPPFPSVRPVTPTLDMPSVQDLVASIFSESDWTRHRPAHPAASTAAPAGPDHHTPAGHHPEPATPDSPEASQAVAPAAHSQAVAPAAQPDTTEDTATDRYALADIAQPAADTADVEAGADTYQTDVPEAEELPADQFPDETAGQDEFTEPEAAAEPSQPDHQPAGPDTSHLSIDQLTKVSQLLKNVMPKETLPSFDEQFPLNMLDEEAAGTVEPDDSMYEGDDAAYAADDSVPTGDDSAYAADSAMPTAGDAAYTAATDSEDLGSEQYVPAADDAVAAGEAYEPDVYAAAASYEQIGGAATGTADFGTNVPAADPVAGPSIRLWPELPPRSKPVHLRTEFIPRPLPGRFRSSNFNPAPEDETSTAEPAWPDQPGAEPVWPDETGSASSPDITEPAWPSEPAWPDSTTDESAATDFAPDTDHPEDAGLTQVQLNVRRRLDAARRRLVEEQTA